MAALPVTSGTSLAPFCPETEKHQHQHQHQHQNQLSTDGRLLDTLCQMPPPLSTSRRPQTLKQARRAYQKSGKSHRLTATEIAAAERRAELQQRADRIKEREARRRANLKKREQKIAKEKEIAAKLGKPFDNGKHWDIGPSQLNLGRFFGGANVQDERPEAHTAKDVFHKSTSLNTKEQQPVLPPVSMPPPPRPMTKARDGDFENAESPIAFEKVCRPDQGPNEYCGTESDGIEDFFVSNTQIAAELFTPARTPNVSNDKLYHPPSSPPRLPASITPCRLDEAHRPISDEAVELLESLSTQDLNFPFEATQQPPIERETLSDTNAAPSSNQYPVLQPTPLLPHTHNDDDRGGLDGEGRAQNTKWTPSYPRVPLNAMSTSSFSEDDLTDHDLRHLALEVESQLTSYTGEIKT